MGLRGAFLAQLTRKPSKMLLPIMEIVYISGRIAEKLQCRLPKGANGNSGRVCFCVAILTVSSPSSLQEIETQALLALEQNSQPGDTAYSTSVRDTTHPTTKKRNPTSTPASAKKKNADRPLPASYVV